MAKPDSDSADRDNDGVRVPPPLIFLGFLLVGLWYDSPWLDGHLASIEATIVGGIIAVLGLALIFNSAAGHRNAGTDVAPWKPTTTIISSGAYGYTRNPIYLGMALAHLGLAICGGSVGAGATLLLSILVIRIYVITREERYLESKFGDSYADYKKRVRRWI
jgi:protein-S-isoprenylcysteine O-methyltransferase Ste14